jgi:tRNA(fMet)-specific endonuclease VapC
MPARYLLDTNIVSYLLKNPIPAVQSRYFEAGADSIAISSITEAEVFYGIAKRPGAKRLRIAAEEFFAAATVAGWDSAAARAYGLLRADQERKGRPLSVEDLMIAAHALSLGLTLVTHDSAFSFVDGLKTEDWTVGKS